MINIKLKKIKKFLLLMLTLSSVAVYSSPVLMPKTQTEVNIFSTDNILTAIAIVLLIPIYLLSKTLLFSVKLYVEKEKKTKETVLKTMLLLVGLCSLNFSFSQNAVTEAMVNSKPILTSTNILMGIVLLEALVIIFFGAYILAFLKGFKSSNKLTNPVVVKQSKITTWWKKTNNFIPIEEEDKLDSGHSYDGIRELDNNIPSWFTAAFFICILVSIIYLWRYHVSQSAPLQLAEYNLEMQQAAKEKEEYLKTAANNVDENTITMLDATGITEGKNLFEANCGACHSKTGAGSPGGVGPNLTDAYWLHGGSLKDIFKTIKYGWPDKGMRSWKDQFNANQIAQLASYVKTISNTNVPGGKEQQGELYKEEILKKDSIANKIDSLITKKL